VIAISVGAAGAAAQPADKPDFKKAAEHYKNAEAAMAGAAYEYAASEYGIAYEITKDPVLFFKIAQADEKAGKCPAAVTYYRRYLKEGHPNDEFKKNTAEHMKACGAADADAGATDTKPVDTKPVDTKPVDTKPVDTKPASTRPADTKVPPPAPAVTTSPAPAPETSSGVSARYSSSRSTGSSPKRKMMRLERPIVRSGCETPAVNSRMQCGSFDGGPCGVIALAGTAVPEAQTSARGSITASCSALRSASASTLRAPSAASAQDACGPVPPT